MNAAEIAETLLNGNIANARRQLIYGHGGTKQRDAYDAAVMALDVVAELAILLSADSDGMSALLAHERALTKVRRCLEGT